MCANLKKMQAVMREKITEYEIAGSPQFIRQVVASLFQ